MGHIPAVSNGTVTTCAVTFACGGLAGSASGRSVLDERSGWERTYPHARPSSGNRCRPMTWSSSSVYDGPQPSAM